MEKRRNIIALLAIAMICVLTMPLLPHHHHGGELCMAREYCADDHAMNDEHTHHHGDSTTCVADGGTFFVRTHTGGFPVLAKMQPAALLGADQWHAVVTADTGGRPCPHRQPGCKSVDLCRAKQLRAPPAPGLS